MPSDRRPDSALCCAVPLPLSSSRLLIYPVFGAYRPLLLVILEKLKHESFSLCIPNTKKLMYFTS